MSNRIVAALLRLYPTAWRKEYGPELAHMLLARPLTAGIFVNVAWSALHQRVRAIEAPTRVGLGLMLVMIAAIAWNIADPPPYALATGRPRLAERIEWLQRPGDSEVYVLVLVAIGFWARRRGYYSAGRAAMKVSTFASLPLVVTGLLMLSGVLGVVELNPSQLPTTFHEHGFSYTFYNAGQPFPAPLQLLISPLLRLPGAWMWGIIGCWIARTFFRGRRTASA